MKEKRIDIYLALASFSQIMFVGLGGTFLNELTQDNVRMAVVYSTLAGCIALGFAIWHFYSKANSLFTKHKK